MPISEGNVYGLRQYVNDWYAEHVQRQQLCDFVPDYPPVILQVATDCYLSSLVGAEGHYPDGAIGYNLVGRRGMLAVWEIESIFVVPWGAQIEILLAEVRALETSYPTLIQSGDEYAAGLHVCDEPIPVANGQRALKWMHLYFLTQAMPWPRATVRDNVPEIVVMIAESDDALAEEAVWRLLLDWYAPECLPWLLETVGIAAPGESLANAPTDPFREEGSDR